MARIDLVMEMKRAGEGARETSKKRLGTKVFASFLERYNALIETTLLSNPEPASRKRTTWRRSPTTWLARCSTSRQKSLCSPPTYAPRSPATKPNLTSAW